MKPLVDVLQTLNIRALYRAVVVHGHRITQLECHMSKLDDVIAEIDTATNDIAAELDRLRSDIAAGDSNAAERLGPVADRLRALASDPNNPVPPVEPTPSA